MAKLYEMRERGHGTGRTRMGKGKWFGPNSHTFARFFRHSVHAVGVTTPWPLLRLDICCAAPSCPVSPPPGPAAPGAVLGWPPAGVPDEVDDAWGPTDWPEGPEAEDDGRDESGAPPAELVTESLVSGIMGVRA